MPDDPGTSSSTASSTPRWLILAALVLSGTLVLLDLLLATDMIPGYPDTAEKSVAIYQGAAQNSAGLSVYLHPPLNSIQTIGHEQQLAFQFSNAGPDIHVSDLRLSSPDCLRIDLESSQQAGPATPSGTPQKTIFNLSHGQSAVYLYKLSSSDSCLGQFPLVFTYDWRPMTPEETAAQASGAPPPQKSAAIPATEHQSISTGPVLVTTPGKLKWERLFSLSGKTVPVILLPVLLALATMLFQHLQERRAALQKDLEDSKSDLQKKQEQRLQVWRMILPAFMDAVRKYYVPMLSIISVMTTETGKPAAKPPAEADLDEVLAGALLLRNKFTNMIWHNGGFYFKNLAGEQLCTVLFDALMDRCYLLAGNKKDDFRAAAEALPDDSTPSAVKEMVRKARANSPFVVMRSSLTEQIKADPKLLTKLNAHLNAVAELLTYEANVPLFPWYEAPYELKKDNIKLDELGLEPGTEKALNAYIAEIEKAFDDYVKSLDRTQKRTAPPAVPRKSKPSQSRP